MRLVAVSLVLAGLAAPAAVATAEPAAPPAERTAPVVTPRRGTPRSAYVVRFTLRQEPGVHGIAYTDYRLQVERRGAAARCRPPQPAPVRTGSAGDRVAARLAAPARGWCPGRYRVTVLLERGPYCPPPEDGRPRPCPAFASQDLDTGSARFVVGRRR